MVGLGSVGLVGRTRLVGAIRQASEVAKGWPRAAGPDRILLVVRLRAGRAVAPLLLARALDRRPLALAVSDTARLARPVPLERARVRRADVVVVPPVSRVRRAVSRASALDRTRDVLARERPSSDLAIRRHARPPRTHARTRPGSAAMRGVALAELLA